MSPLLLHNTSQSGVGICLRADDSDLAYALLALNSAPPCEETHHQDTLKEIVFFCEDNLRRMAPFVVVLLITLVLQTPLTVISKSGECHCAIYKQGMSAAEQWPLISVTPLIRVPCDSKGKRGCREVCIDMANQTWLKTSSFMCGMLKGDTDAMELAVFFKSCSNIDWEATGITTTTTFCCRIGRPTEC